MFRLIADITSYPNISKGQLKLVALLHSKTNYNIRNTMILTFFQLPTYAIRNIHEEEG